MTSGWFNLRKFTITILAFLFLASFFVAGTAAGQSNNSTNEALPHNVQGIWSLSLKGTEQLTLAMHQEGSLLFGSAKSEGVMSGGAVSEGVLPWNAAVMGEISGNRVELTLTSLQGQSLMSLKLLGSIEGESLKGSFVQADDRGGSDSGLFTAVMINPNLSAYTPEEIKSAIKSATSTEASAPADSAAENAVDQEVQPKQLSSTQYTDVHTMKGIVPENLGVGFIGDGTMGAGGMGMG